MSYSATVSPPCLSSSAVTSSSPPALLFFSPWIYLDTSSIEMLSIATSNKIMGVSCSKSIRLVSSGKMFHPSVRLFFFSRKCTSVFALDRNSGNTPGVGQFTNIPVHTCGAICVCCLFVPLHFVVPLTVFFVMCFPSLLVFCLESCTLGHLPLIYQVPGLTRNSPLPVGSSSIPQNLRCALCDIAQIHLPLLLKICGMV